MRGVDHLVPMEVADVAVPAGKKDDFLHIDVLAVFSFFV